MKIQTTDDAEKLIATIDNIKPSTNVRKNAEALLAMQLVVDAFKVQMDKYIKSLLDQQPNELFEEGKVVYAPGKEQTYLDNAELLKHINQPTFNMIATVTEKALNDIMVVQNRQDETDFVIAKSKVIKGVGKPTIKVSDLSKADKILLGIA